MNRVLIDKKKYNKVLNDVDPSLLEIECVISRRGLDIDETRFLRERSQVSLWLNVCRSKNIRLIGNADIRRCWDEEEQMYFNAVRFSVIRKSFIPIAKALLNETLFLVLDFDDKTKTFRGAEITYANPYDEEVAKCNGDCIREMYNYSVNLYRLVV